MKEQISIKVNIADRVFPLKVSIEEEENIRKAAEMINGKVKLYVEQYAIKDKQAALSMCALELATEILNTDIKENETTEDLLAKLSEIEAHLKEN